MSRAWLTIPSARPSAEANIALERWRNRGYGIALWCVDGSDHEGKICDVKLTGPKYPGWAASINILAAHVLKLDQECEWVVGGGDDTHPEPMHPPDEIAEECYEYFDYSTFGVMQPTGDSWSDDHGRIIERIAGSPWMGREWCRRINKGNGPLWGAYPHCWADEELQLVAQEHGVFWQRRDLMHYHKHPMRDGGKRPAWLEWTNADYGQTQGLFRQRKAAGFPGSEPL